MVTNQTFFFFTVSQRSRPLSWAVTSQQMTNTSWQDLETRRPPSTRSSTREESLCFRIYIAMILPSTIHLWTTTDWDKLQNWWNSICWPKDACTGKKFLSFYSSRGWVALFHDFRFFFLFLRKFGCNPVKQRFISENLIPQTSCEKCTYWIK